MQEMTIISNFKKINTRLDYLQSSLVQKESTIFALWSTVNTLMKLLEQKGQYTKEEFAELGKKIQADREVLIKRLALEAKEKGQTQINKTELHKTDSAQQAIDIVHPSGINLKEEDNDTVTIEEATKQKQQPKLEALQGGQSQNGDSGSNETPSTVGDQASGADGQTL